MADRSAHMLSVKEAAEALRCSSQTVYRACHEGRLESFQLRENGQIKIPVSALEGLIRPQLLDAADAATIATSTEEVRS